MKRVGILLLLFFAYFAVAAWPQAQTHPRHHQYTLYDLGTFGGPNSTTSVFATSLTRQGAIGGAQTDALNPFSPNCLADYIWGFGCSVLHAFQWKDGLLTDLSSLPGNDGNNSSFAAAINHRGLIAGYSEDGSIDPVTGYPVNHPVVWDRGRLIDLGTFGGSQSEADALNDRGQVVGWALNTIEDPFSTAFEMVGYAGIWPVTTQLRAFVWENGVKSDLGTLGGPDALAYAINERGQIAGQSYTSYTPNPDTGMPTMDPFLWDKGMLTDLGTLGGTIGNAIWLNNRGQVVGSSNVAGDQFSHGFLWERGVLKDLPPFSGGSYSNALWINEAGDVVGGAAIAGDQQVHASLWRHGKTLGLGTVGQDACSEAWGINEDRQIVGVSFPCWDLLAGRAFLWENGGPMVDLNALIEKPSDLHLWMASYISDRGEIVADGILPNGDIHTAVLVPHGHCGGDCEQRIMESMNAPAAPARASSMMPASGNLMNWLRSRQRPRHIPDGR
jgi:probable HAF family extracellular repeat protein